MKQPGRGKQQSGLHKADGSEGTNGEELQETEVQTCSRSKEWNFPAMHQKLKQIPSM